MRENDFTNTVLMPLFMSFGYEKVEFYGGSYENGKDLICWKRDSWGDVEMTVGTSKMLQTNWKAQIAKSLRRNGCPNMSGRRDPTPYSDGQMYKPIQVNIVTPYVIDTRVLETAFYKYAAIKNYKIKVIQTVITL